MIVCKMKCLAMALQDGAAVGGELLGQVKLEDRGDGGC